MVGPAERSETGLFVIQGRPNNQTKMMTTHSADRTARDIHIPSCNHVHADIYSLERKQL